MTDNPLTMRMEQFTRFNEAERERLDELVSGRHQTYLPGETIIAEGERVRNIHLVTSGLAARSKALPDGDRQIMAFLIPGDLLTSRSSSSRPWTTISLRSARRHAPSFPPPTSRRC